MSRLVLLPRPKLGSKACKLLRSAGFIPGIIRACERSLPVSVCAKLIRRLPYRRSVQAVLNNKIIALKLTRYQLDPVSFEIRHVEYQRCKSVLANSTARVLIFNATGCAAVKSGAKFKVLHTKLNLVGEVSLSPNYIKVDISDCLKGDDIALARLRCKRAQFATTESRCVLVTIR
ncbi:50S ribosomal protein L25/general stress protein Ctc [Candidatus Hodgkinia cicadicola]|nr:50S ribosomal protein L25/general stress protein Ctc [Candidatus Hodgkinia cicadicola]